MTRAHSVLLLISLVLPGSATAFESTHFGTLAPGASRTTLEDGIDLVTEVVQPGSTVINGTPTAQVLQTSGPDVGSAAFATNDAGGLLFHREFVPGIDGGTLTFSPPAIELPGTFALLDTFSQSDVPVAVTFNAGGGTTVYFDASATVVGIESVTVGAGTFNAVRIDGTNTLSESIGGPIVLSEMITEWWVPHLGTVKSAGASDGEAFLSELQSHNIFLCGDLDENGVVEASDVTLYRQGLTTSFSVSEQARCRTTASSGGCDVTSLVVQRREVEGPLLSPGITNICTLP